MEINGIFEEHFNRYQVDSNIIPIDNSTLVVINCQSIDDRVVVKISFVYPTGLYEIFELTTIEGIYNPKIAYMAAILTIMEISNCSEGDNIYLHIKDRYFVDIYNNADDWLDDESNVYFNFYTRQAIAYINKFDINVVGDLCEDLGCEDLNTII